MDSVHSALTELRNLDQSDHLPVISGQQKQRNGDGLFDVLRHRLVHAGLMGEWNRV